MRLDVPGLDGPAPCLRHAYGVLSRWKIAAVRVYRVDPDRIAFVDPSKQARTALIVDYGGEPMVRGVLHGWPL